MTCPERGTLAMSPCPLISIGMPVYNCERTVADAIASILNQSFEDWELIVYDDGSLDATVDMARQFSDPRIHVVEGGRNRGLPICLNEIITKCRSEYFARMDGDDIAYPNRLQIQLEFLQVHTEVDLAAGSILVFHTGGTEIGVRRGAVTHEQICVHPWSGIPMAHPTWMGRTKWFRSNPYNVDMVRMEDWELLFRTYRHSRFANMPQIVLGYREDSLSLRKILLARQHKSSALLDSAWGDRAAWHATCGIAGQIAKAMVDIAAIGLRLNYHLLKHRVPPVAAVEVQEWQVVLNKTRQTVREQSMVREEVSA